jgi:protein TonB
MDTRAKIIRFLPVVIGIIIVIGVTYLAVQFLTAEDDAPPRKKVVQQITVIAPPPPPPPPPEKEPEVQEPEEEEEVIEEMDEAMPDEGMDEDIGNDLGLDADGSAGGDGFGLLARKGGRSLLGGGYGALVVQEINTMLVDDERLRGKEYTVILSIWISATGVIERYKIDKRSAESEVVASLESALTRLGSFSSGAPLEEPQPIRLRIKSRL